MSGKAKKSVDIIGWLALVAGILTAVLQWLSATPGLPVPPWVFLAVGSAIKVVRGLSRTLPMGQGIGAVVIVVAGIIAELAPPSGQVQFMASSDVVESVEVTKEVVDVPTTNVLVGDAVLTVDGDAVDAGLHP